MLHPNQFQVHEAWIVFWLNDALIQTEVDGAFNCLALMDAASCYIFGSELVPANVAEPSRFVARALLKQGQARAQQLPQTLFIAIEQSADGFVEETALQTITVARVPENDLLICTEDARNVFKKQIRDMR